MIEQMTRGMGRMMASSMGTEILYSFVIILCSLMIYLGTKELYEISKHKGIKYFRLTFLFFALAYFSRSFIKTIAFYFNASGILSISPILLHPLVGQISLFFFIYLSTMAMFYLLISVKWKSWNEPTKKVYFAQVLAFLISLFILYTRNGLFYLFLNLVLLVLVVLAIYTSKSSKDKKQKLGIHTTYSLLAFFWILNTADILLPSFFQTTQILIYLASSGLFLLILYKVLKKAGN